MSVKKLFTDVVFNGWKAAMDNISTNAGVPGYNAARIGELCYDTVGGDGYIATDLVGTWVKLNA